MNCKSLLSLTAILHCSLWFLIPQAKAASGDAGPKLPQLDVQTYASQIFWLVVSFIVLYFLVAKVAMPRISEVLEERQERIEDDLDKAETLKTSTSNPSGKVLFVILDVSFGNQNI